MFCYSIEIAISRQVGASFSSSSSSSVSGRKEGDTTTMERERKRVESNRVESLFS